MTRTRTPLRHTSVRSFSALGLTLCALALSSCSSTVVPQPGFSFTASSATVSLTAGDPGISVSLLATAQGNFTSPVTVAVSGLPTGVTLQPTPLVLTPGTSTQITLTAAANAPAASTPVTLTATSGSFTQTLQITVNVALSPDFALGLTSQTLNLNQAQRGQSFQVMATPLNGFTGNISVALSNLPPGVSTSAANLTLTPGVPQTVTLTAAAAAQLGSGSATLTATSGNLVHTGSVALTVYLAGIQTTPFVHPGIAHSLADLDRMKNNVAAGIEPYKSMYNALGSTGYASYNNTGQGPYTYETYGHGQFEIRNDASVAHTNAVWWYITGDTRYRDNAIHIMMAWANTMTAFDVTDVLTAGSVVRDFANTAEIIRYTGNGAWPPAQITQFQNWMLNLLYPALLYGSTIDPPTPIGPAGFGGLQMGGFVSLGVFLDRPDIYNFGVSCWQHYGGYAYGLREYIDASGQNYETQRDIGHASGNLGTFATTAYVVWNQGQDLFSMNNNLLAKAFESQAKFDMGWDVAPIPFLSADGYMHVKMSSENRNANGHDGLEAVLGYSIYHNVKGLEMPYTKLSADLAFPWATDGLYYLRDDSARMPLAPVVGAPAPTGVMLFEDYLGGTYLTNLPAGTYNHAALVAAGMGQYGSGPVSSLKLPIGWTVIAYSGDNLTGNSVTITGTLANRGTIDMIDPAVNFNDQLYSMKVIAGTQPYPIFDGTYQLANLGSGKFAEVVANSLKPGATLDQSTNTASQNQLWRIQAVGHNQFSIRNLNSTLALGVDPAALGAGSSLDQQIYVPAPNLATGGTASASSDNAGNNEGAAQAFDGSVSTKWNNGGGAPSTGWLQYHLPVAAVVDTYVLTSAGDVPGRDPAAWQLLGSNDGATWTVLDTQTGQAFVNRNQPVTYNLTNVVPYSYYRLNITANQGGNGYNLQLAELGLFNSLSGSANQRWTIAAVPNTTIGSAFTITNVATGMAFDVGGNNTADGAPLVQNTPTGASSQRWAIQIPPLLLP